ncbi:MAG TPA: hypothetical protein VM943_13365 [Pyrinomonadaceae bacterium]|nr:hypothetical protein [Pyrinomonadaceae bacterium]
MPAEESEHALPCAGGGSRVVDFGARVVEEGLVGLPTSSGDFVAAP